MQLSDLPLRFPIPFANNAGSAFIRSIPKDHVDATSTDAPASLYDGFPPEAFSPIASGGVPPSGQDFNGILNQLSAWARWGAAGGPAKYDATFSAAIGGYPKNAMLMSTVTAGVSWVSLVDNNTTDPDSVGAANWQPLGGAVVAGNGSSGSASLGGGFTVTWRSISVPAGGTTSAYGNGKVYSSFAHAWSEGDDGINDVSVRVTASGLSSATLSNTGNSCSAILFSLGV